MCIVKFGEAYTPRLETMGLTEIYRDTDLTGFLGPIRSGDSWPGHLA